MRTLRENSAGWFRVQPPLRTVAWGQDPGPGQGPRGRGGAGGAEGYPRVRDSEDD